MKRILGEGTLVPLSFVAVLVGVVVWLTTLHNEVADASKDVEDIKIEQRQYNKDIKKVIRKLTRIETHLGIEAKENENE